MRPSPFRGRFTRRNGARRLDLTTGERTLWQVLQPPHPMAVLYISTPVVAANGSRYAYSYMRVVSNLYFVDGLG